MALRSAVFGIRAWLAGHGRIRLFCRVNTFSFMPLPSSEIPRELWEAYGRTEYWIEGTPRLCLWVDQNAVGLMGLLASSGLAGLSGARSPSFPWAYLTAWNPHSVCQSEDVNRARQSALESRLKEGGTPCIPGVAHDPTGEWPDEKGLLAIGLTHEQALEWGRAFEQNAILIGLGEGKVELARC
jgi:hypothetical protein